MVALATADRVARAADGRVPGPPPSAALRPDGIPRSDAQSSAVGRGAWSRTELEVRRLGEVRVEPEALVETTRTSGPKGDPAKPLQIGMSENRFHHPRPEFR